MLFRGELMLLLQRASWKTFAPNRWTGLGGKVEPSELGDLDASARRELLEEADLTPADVSDLRLLRCLTFHHPVEGLVCLLYYVGEYHSNRIPSCNEGSLAWVHPSQLSNLDLIENTAQVLPLLALDVAGVDRTVRCGVAHYDKHAQLKSITWETD